MTLFFTSLQQRFVSAFLIFILFFYFSLASQATDLKNKKYQPPESIILTADNSNYIFTNHVNYFEDKTSTLSFENINENIIPQQFKTMERDNLSLGYIKSTLWLKFKVLNQSNNQDNWLLILDYPLLDEVVIYSKREQGEWQHLTMGDNLPFSQRQLDHRLFINKLDIKLNETIEFVIKVKTTSSMQIRPYITSSETFLVNELDDEMFYGIIYGIMLLMALYNVFLYLAVKDKTYLVYVFSVLSGCIFIMALNGHAYQYLWPNSPQLANKLVPLLVAIWMATTAMFTQMFLETKRFSPRLYTAMNWQYALAVISIIISLFGPYQLAIKIATGLALINGLLILSTSIVCLTKANRFARYFVGAWLLYGIGTAMLILSRYGLLPDNFVTHNSASLGLLVEIIMLSLALSDKYRILTTELEQHAHKLELKVAQRTAELEISNQQLIALSHSDALTGLANRRHLDHQLANEWSRGLRAKTPISLLVIDIDQFKNINDHFGHQYGDDCILEVAEILKHSVTRPSDLPARFGGDEFVIVLPNTDSEGALNLGEEICTSLERSNLKQAPNSLYPVVTLSIGCATFIPNNHNNIRNLFALADKNLYRAKKQGRNGVIS